MWVVFFQWQPPPSLTGRVVFRAVVRHLQANSWSTTFPVTVQVVDTEEISTQDTATKSEDIGMDVTDDNYHSLDVTSDTNMIYSEITTLTEEYFGFSGDELEESSKIDMPEKRKDTNNDSNKSENTTESFRAEPYTRLEPEFGGWSPERSQASRRFPFALLLFWKLL